MWGGGVGSGGGGAGLKVLEAAEWPLVHFRQSFLDLLSMLLPLTDFLP